MNRAVHLNRPPPTVNDLALTAQGMLQNSGGVDAGDWHWQTIEPIIWGLARGYGEVYGSQELADFWGLREFYSLVRSIGQRYVAGFLT